MARLLLCVAALVPAASVQAQNQNPIVLRFSHVVAPDTPKGKAAELFKKLAEQRTAGRVRVEVHAGGSLYSDSEEMHALRSGDVQMLAPSVSKFTPLGLPEFEIFDAPYLIDGDRGWRTATRGSVAQELLKKLEDKGIVGLAYWSGGSKHLSANRELRHPADLRGLRMRIQPSKVSELQMRALGASPLALPFSNVYEALRTGAVDGTENTASNIHASNFYKVQKHLTLTGHGYLGYAVIVNKRFWDELPESIRKALESALNDATDYQSEIAAEVNRQALEAIAQSGRTRILRPSEAEMAAWKAAFAQARGDIERRVGGDTIRRLQKELGQGEAR